MNRSVDVFITRIEKHIIDRLCEPVPGATIEDKLQTVVGCYYTYKQWKEPECAKTFENWLKCEQPSIKLEHSLDGQRKALSEWYDEEPKGELSSSGVSRLYYALIFTTLVGLFEKYDIKYLLK